MDIQVWIHNKKQMCFPPLRGPCLIKADLAPKWNGYGLRNQQITKYVFLGLLHRLWQPWTFGWLRAHICSWITWRKCCILSPRFFYLNKLCGLKIQCFLHDTLFNDPLIVEVGTHMQSLDKDGQGCWESTMFKAWHVARCKGKLPSTSLFQRLSWRSAYIHAHGCSRACASFSFPSGCKSGITNRVLPSTPPVR